MSKISSLGDIVTFVGGGTPDRKKEEYWGGEIPWATVKVFNSGNLLKKPQESITQIGLKSSAANLIKAGTLIIPTRMALGKAAIASVDMAINQDLKAVIPNTNIDTRYLLWYFIANSRKIDEMGKGATVKGVTLDQLRQLKINIPALEEQRRIAAILDKAEALRAKRRKAIAKLDLLLQSVFLEMFDVKDSGWAEVNVGDITDVQGGLQLSTAREKIENKKPYLRVANVYRNRLDLSEIKYFGVTDSEFLRTKLEKNDILIVEGHGNPDEIGRSAIWDGSVKDCTHQNHLIRCRINTNKVLPEYLNFYMNSDLGKFHLKKSSNTTSGLNTISVSKVRSLPVILAPIDEQKKWVNFQNKIEKMKNLHKVQLKFNDSLIYSLQSQYFQR